MEIKPFSGEHNHGDSTRLKGSVSPAAGNTSFSAYRLNQPKVGKKHLQTMRELIKKEQADADNEDGKDDKDDDSGNPVKLMYWIPTFAGITT